jgi:hypothetical protein
MSRAAASKQILQTVSNESRHRKKHQYVLWNQKSREMFGTSRAAVDLSHKNLARIEVVESIKTKHTDLCRASREAGKESFWGAENQEIGL